MKGVAVLYVLVAACHAARAPSPTAQSVSTTSSFSANGAAVAESVGPDGSKTGECAFSDNTGLKIRVRYVLRPREEPEFVLVEGNQGQDPAEAYRTCMDAYSRSQANAQSAFSMGFNPFFNPFFFNPFDFNSFTRSEGNFDEAAADPLNGALSSRIASFANKMEARNRDLEQRNFQLQENLRRLEQQNLEMQRRLMAQIDG